MNGQEIIGSRVDNYNPVNGQMINPASIVDAKPWIDINLIGVNVFVENNYFFYPQTTLLNFKSFNSEASTDPGTSHLSGHLNTRISGPSMSMVLGRQSFSIFTSVRAIGHANQLPYVISKTLTESGLDQEDVGLYSLENSRAKAALWGEIGVSLGSVLKAKETRMITGGVSIKYLFGIQNTSISVPEGQVGVISPDTLFIKSDGGTYAFTEPSSTAGRGLATDLGIQFKKMKENVSHYIPHSTYSYCKSINYVYKLGISLLDLGFIRFKNEAYYGSIDELRTIDTLTGTDDLLDEAKLKALGNRYLMPAPMALSIQADYNLNDKFYLNGTLIQRFPNRNTYGPERANVLTVSARYERKYFGMGLPITYYNYKKVYLGLNLRIANLIIGTENLFPFFIKQDVYSASIYFNLKLLIHQPKPCRHKTKKVKKTDYKTHECATWD